MSGGHNLLQRAPPAYGRWVSLATQLTRSRVLYNVTQNNSGVEDPQYMSDLAPLGKKLGRNRPEPARQPYISDLRSNTFKLRIIESLNAIIVAISQKGYLRRTADP